MALDENYDQYYYNSSWEEHGWTKLQSGQITLFAPGPGGNWHAPLTQRVKAQNDGVEKAEKYSVQFQSIYF